MLQKLRRFLSLTLCALLLVAMLPGISLSGTAVEAVAPAEESTPEKTTSESAYIAEGSCGENVSFRLSENGTLTIRGNGQMENYDRYNNILTPWYESRSLIRKVVVENGVTSIGDEAFEDCSSLTDIAIPDSVTRLGASAFEDCSSLTSVNIPDSVTILGEYVFTNCSSLTSVNIPDSMTWIASYAFMGCSSLTSITIPESLTNIRYNAFYGCTSLKSVYITNMEIWCRISFESSSSNPLNTGASLYLNGMLVTNLIIPDSVTSIGYYAFEGCSSLTSVTIPESVTSIGFSAFFGCTSLTSITIPDSVTNIVNGTFSGCSSLTSIIIPDSVTSIGNYAFSRCSSLTSITIPNGVTSMSSQVFQDCSSLTSITIPESVTSIGQYAFKDCSSLTGITIPESVTSIGDSAFQRCSSLTSITIPDGVPRIGNWTFDGCSSLTSVTIPDSVTNIDNHAFNGCSSLTDITIPDGVTRIGNYAFEGCSSLTDITIPGSMTSIGDHAFRSCKKLTSITFLGAAPSISPSGFYYVRATAYYPCNDETWTSSVKANYAGTLTWEGLHTFDDTIITKDATCAEDAVEIITCLNCGFTVTTPIPGTATGHTVGENGLCVKCGKFPDIIISMKDSCGDGWNGAAIEVYANGELVTTATISSGSSNEVILPYTPAKTYTFKWVSGSYNLECSFTITMNDEVLYTCSGAPDSEIFYAIEMTCVHQYERETVQPTCTQDGTETKTCSICGETVVVTLPATGHSHQTEVTAPTCTEAGYTTYTCHCGDQFVADPVKALGHSFENGTCINCGEADPDYVKPTVDMKFPTLSFEDVIIMNVYYTATDIQNVAEMGLITYTEKPAEGSVETADHVVPGYDWSEGDRMYYSSTTGIAPKDLGDTIYFGVYWKLTNGTYGYTNVISYSPKTYAMNMLGTGTTEMKTLVAAMLNYGAAAQIYFGYNTDTLVGADMTDEQKALAAAYTGDMIATITQASGDKLGTFINDKTYSARYTTITFEGAFCINYYFKPTLAVKGDVTMYIWSLEDFEAVEVLTKENATKTVKMELTESGEYLATVDGIAAKDLDKAVYVSFVYSDGTTEHCGGVLGYTIGMYCKSQAAKTGTLADLAKACAVYGYYAKQLFG